MRDIINAEVYRLKKSKLFWGIIIYVFIIFIAAYHIDLEGGAEGEKMISSASQLFELQNGYALFVSQIFFAAIRASQFISDYKSGYVKDVVGYGNNRFQFWLSKTLVYTLGNIIIYLAGFAAIILGGAVAGEGFGVFSQIPDNTIPVMLVSAIAVSAISFLLSAIIIAIPHEITLIFIIATTNIFLQVAVISEMFPKFVKYFPLTAFVGINQENFSASTFFRAVGVLAYTVIISALIVKLTFCRKEIK